MKKNLKKFLHRQIVVDSDSSWIYLGTLEKIFGNCIVLSDVDAHDNSDTATSKELYVLESKSTGIKSNRSFVHINLEYVISFSLLEDIKEF